MSYILFVHGQSYPAALLAIDGDGLCTAFESRGFPATGRASVDALQ
jgi:hypothetical protein